MSSKDAPPKYIKYVPAQAGAQPKIIRMVEVQKDPLEPARFKLNQKVPRAPPSPPVPIMHSPPRKVTAEEQKEWKIPPCVSSWKNPRGYTVPLDKRCAFNGRDAAHPQPVNPKFAQLSEALYISTRQHREALEDRAKAERMMAEKEKERNEEKLRKIAQKARLERVAVQQGLSHSRGDHSDKGEDSDDEEFRERARIRDERHRERVRNVNIKASNPNRRTNFDRERERDISEQIAIGVARPDTHDTDVHDQRLYNHTEGLGHGFADDDEEDVYDRAWKSAKSFSNNNYRPSESVLKDSIDHEAEKASKETVRVAPGPNVDELAPIQFDKDDVEDIFNVESFLRNAKYNAKKMMQQEASSSSSNSHRHASKRHKS